MLGAIYYMQGARQSLLLKELPDRWREVATKVRLGEPKATNSKRALICVIIVMANLVGMEGCVSIVPEGCPKERSEGGGEIGG